MCPPRILQYDSLATAKSESSHTRVISGPVYPPRAQGQVFSGKALLAPPRPTDSTSQPLLPPMMEEDPSQDPQSGQVTSAGLGMAVLAQGGKTAVPLVGYTLSRTTHTGNMVKGREATTGTPPSWVIEFHVTVPPLAPRMLLLGWVPVMGFHHPRQWVAL